MVKELHTVHGSVLLRLNVLEEGGKEGGNAPGAAPAMGPVLAEGQGPSSEELKTIQVRPCKPMRLVHPANGG